jgi:hypothetical protein
MSRTFAQKAVPKNRHASHLQGAAGAWGAVARAVGRDGGTGDAATGRTETGPGAVTGAATDGAPSRRQLSAGEGVAATGARRLLRLGLFQ